jgi:hypothetical protein
MNQMGHAIPNLVDIPTGNLEKKVGVFLPGFMTMGDTGMRGWAKWG